MNTKDIDPLDELRAVRRRIWRKYKTIDAYVEHLKNQPPVEEIIAKLQKKIERQEARKTKNSRKRRTS